MSLAALMLHAQVNVPRRVNPSSRSNSNDSMFNSDISNASDDTAHTNPWWAVGSQQYFYGIMVTSTWTRDCDEPHGKNETGSAMLHHIRWKLSINTPACSIIFCAHWSYYCVVIVFEPPAGSPLAKKVCWCIR